MCQTETPYYNEFQLKTVQIIKYEKMNKDGFVVTIKNKYPPYIFNFLAVTIHTCCRSFRCRTVSTYFNKLGLSLAMRRDVLPTESPQRELCVVYYTQCTHSD